MRRRISLRKCIRPSVHDAFSRTRTRRILCRVSGLVYERFTPTDDLHLWSLEAVYSEDRIPWKRLAGFRGHVLAALPTWPIPDVDVRLHQASVVPISNLCLFRAEWKRHLTYHMVIGRIFTSQFRSRSHLLSYIRCQRPSLLRIEAGAWWQIALSSENYIFLFLIKFVIFIKFRIIIDFTMKIWQDFRRKDPMTTSLS